MTSKNSILAMVKMTLITVIHSLNVLYKAIERELNSKDE